MYELKIYDYTNNIRKLETQRFELFSEILLYLENCKYYDDIKFILDRNVEKIEDHHDEIVEMRKEGKRIIVMTM